MSSVGIKIKLEREEPGGDVDVARGRFENALQELLHKSEESDSENDSDGDSKSKVFTKLGMSSILTSRGTRPPRKRRRKEVELRDLGFHHTFVMRMFDRSVDLAQFDETSPLYPICRAWMINQPHNSSLNVKSEPLSPIHEMANSTEEDGDIDVITELGPDEPPRIVFKLPAPNPWSDRTSNQELRIPKPLPHPVHRLEVIDGDDTLHGFLLSEHIERWREIRNLWKNTSKVNDERYQSSYNILKTMFDRS